MNKEKISGRVYAAIIATGIMSFCGVIVETSMNIAFPTLMQQFNISTNLVQWMTSIYLLIISIVVPLSAALKSSFKTKSLFLAANILFLIGLIIDSIAPNFTLLLLGRAIQGLGTGIALPLMFNIILEQVPKSKVGTMMGVGNLITGIAPAIGPTFGGIVVADLGWRYVFYFLIPLILISLFLGLWGITQKSEIRKVKMDALSLFAIAVFFTGIIYGFSNLSSAAFLSLQVGGAILIAIIALLVLVWRSNKIETPILNISLFKNSTFSAHIFAFFAIQFISLGNAFLLPNFMQLVNHNTALTAGLIVLPAGAAGAIMSPIGGKLLDKSGARKPIMIGVSLMIVESALFSILIKDINDWAIMIIYIVYMGGMGMTLGNVMTDTLDGFDMKKRTEGNAILNTVQQFAGAVGTSVTSTIVAMSQRQLGGKIGLPTAIGTQHAYWLLLIVNVIVWLLLFRFVKSSKRN